MRGLGLPLDSCYQYISTNHLDRIRNRLSAEGSATAMAEAVMASVGTQAASSSPELTLRRFGASLRGH